MSTSRTGVVTQQWSCSEVWEAIYGETLGSREEVGDRNPIEVFGLSEESVDTSR